MGVPKFYRWISERYPCLSEVVKEYQVPEFDNLYLDMNGIIHNCSHPNDDDPHFRITEEQIFKDIFNYIEVLFRIIRPQRTFFMAVDGVAPRAKMNQQRGRRFRSAKEAENNIKQALQKGEVLPTEKRFDSNCITPGTSFMEKLQAQLEYFVQNKITTDPSWQGIKVYLSGHQTPGEGEHKIMEFIRYERSQPEYDPNTRHCLYGLDADLLMLGLCTHEPHFALLREEVKFTRQKSSKTQNAAQTTFHLLHISLLREYIEHEFEAVKPKLPFEFNIESIIDDWVLMGFLVGNDFIPHLPDLHISTSALPFLYQTYIQVLPTLDGYLNEGGVINLGRLEVYLKAISSFDLDHFEEVYSDYKWLEAKSKSKKATDCLLVGGEVTEDKSLKIVKDLAIKQGTIEATETVDEEHSTFDQEFKLHKRAYYQTKFNIEGTEDEISTIAYEYILGIQWICHYYYNGVQSWDWFYPYHYSPYMSDLCNISTLHLTYNMNQPFLPFQQLLAVLPAASKDCIPEPYWNLMDESSIIGDFYPSNFSTDLNGKQQEWEAVVQIPFIEEERLLSAMESCNSRLSASDKRRNTHGPCQLYSYDPNTPHYVKSSLHGIFPNLEACVAKREDIPPTHWIYDDYRDFTKGLLPGCKLSTYYQGFPTLYHLPHKSYLKKQGVKVFQAPSRNENLILRILPPEEKSTMTSYRALLKKNESLESISERLLGESVYVGWPHMAEGKVVAVTDGKEKVTYQEHTTVGNQSSKHKVVWKMMEKHEVEAFHGDVKDLKDTSIGRHGINIGDTRVILYVHLLLGKKYICGRNGEITLEKQWSNTMQPFALQTVLKDITVKEQTMKSVTTVAEMFPQDAQVFNLGVPHYGCMGKVCSTHGGNATVLFKIPPEPNLTKIFKKMHTMSSYHPGWKIASNVGITGYLLSRITGSIYIYYPETRKWSIGLNLKFTKEKSGIAGFTKRKDNEWLYSDAVTKLLLAYKQRFPRVLRYLEESLMKTSEDSLDLEAMMGSEGIIEKLQELSKWLKSLPSYGGTKVHESSNTIEPIVVSAIDEEIQLFKNKTKDKTTEVKLSVLSHYLYRPLVQQGTLTPDKQAKHHELDRVVNVREGHTVPLGLRGTIIGIHTRGSSEQGVVFDVMFDDEFMGGLTLGGRCPPRRGYSLPVYSVINLTHGERTMNKNNRPVAVVHPHHQGAANQHTLKHGQRLVRSPQSAFTPAKKGNHPPTAVTLLQRGKPPNQRSNHKKPSNTEQPSVSPSGHRGQKKTQKPGIPLNKEKQTIETSLTEAAQTLPKIKIDKPEIKKTNQNTPTNRNAEEFKPTNQNAEEFKPTNQNGEEFKPTNEMTDILSTLTINDPVENINNNNGTHPKQQILPTEQSQATATPEPSAHFNQLLATLGTTKHPHHKETSNPPHKIPPHSYNHQPNPLNPPHQPQLRPHLPPNYYHGPPKPFSLQEFLANPPNYPPPPFHPNNPTLLGPESFQPHPYPPNPTRNPVDFAKEGTDKLCEILNIGDNEEKLTTDTKCQDKWSTGPKENDSLKKEEKEKSNFQDKTESCDRGSDCDEPDERSTSVEAASTQTKEKSKVGELLQWCYQHHVFPPLYTFCKTNETDNISTVELWNGLKFQSLPKLTLELANEECARAALAYVHSEPHPRYSAPPPSAPSYLLQDASMPQYAAVQPLPPMMSPMMSSNHMMSSIMPPAPYYQPSMVNPYLAVGPDVLLYPRYFPASQYGYSPVPHTGGVIPRYTPAFKAVHPIVHGNKGLLHHNQPGQSTSVPQQFIPPQVEHHSPPRVSRSPNYYLSDSPVASSVEKVNKTEKKEQKPRKSKPTLAISFAPTKPT